MLHRILWRYTLDSEACNNNSSNKISHQRLIIVSAVALKAAESMAAAKSSLLDSINDDDLEPSSGPSQEVSSETVVAKPSVARRRANLQETETLYFTVSSPSLNRRSSACGYVLCGDGG